MCYNCTCPNCGYHYTPPSVPINLDWTQWQDITWYDDQGQPMTYPKYQTWFDDGTHIYRALLVDRLYKGEHKPYLWLYRTPISEITDAYENGVWKPTPLLIRSVHSYADSYSDANQGLRHNKLILNRLFGSRQNWETILAEFAEYCSQLVPEDVAKDYSDQLVQK